MDAGNFAMKQADFDREYRKCRFCDKDRKITMKKESPTCNSQECLLQYWNETNEQFERFKTLHKKPKT